MNKRQGKTEPYQYIKFGFLNLKYGFNGLMDNMDLANPYTQVDDTLHEASK